MTDREARLISNTSYASALLLPLVGPLFVLALYRRRPAIRRHAVRASVASAVWMVLTVAVISVDNGSLSLSNRKSSVSANLILWAMIIGMLVFVIAGMGTVRSDRQMQDS